MFVSTLRSANSAEPVLPANCRQCLIVITDSWSSRDGELFLYERSDSSWRQRHSGVPVFVGRAGLAWGRGLLDAQSWPGPRKTEGDDKAPAGVFPLRCVFGYARKAPSIQMPYVALSEQIVAVDDPQSPYYNQLVDKSKIKRPDWRTAEKMILADGRYKWGVFVEHNVPPKPGAGSCIFLHIWKDPETATSGCTAMSEENLVSMIRWLDPARHPLLIQMPRSIYKELKRKLGLPAL